MKKIIIASVAVLSLSALGGCDLNLETYSPENPAPDVFQLTARNIADYCSISVRRLNNIKSINSKNFRCVKSYADTGYYVAMRAVGKAYRRNGRTRRARYYLSLSRGH